MKRRVARMFVCGAAIVVIGFMPRVSLAGTMSVRLPNGMYVTKKVVSLKEARFKNVVPQKYDLSCGAACLATILTYCYAHRVDEKEIIEYMLEYGKKEEIAGKGFSLLDLKNYAEHKGYVAGGYRVKPESLKKLKIPAIIMFKSGGYSHFLVLKGIKGDRVYLADPAFGNRSMGMGEFEKDWNGIIFLLVNKERGLDRSLPLGTAIPAPLMSVMRAREVGAGSFVLIKSPGEF